jgi:hypothetical protein
MPEWFLSFLKSFTSAEDNFHSQYTVLLRFIEEQSFEINGRCDRWGRKISNGSLKEKLLTVGI